MDKSEGHCLTHRYPGNQIMAVQIAVQPPIAAILSQSTAKNPDGIFFLISRYSTTPEMWSFFKFQSGCRSHAPSYKVMAICTPAT